MRGASWRATCQARKDHCAKESRGGKGRRENNCGVGTRDRSIPLGDSNLYYGKQPATNVAKANMPSANAVVYQNAER